MKLGTISVKQLQLPFFLCFLLLFLIAYPYLHQRYPDQIAIVEISFALLMISGVCLLVNHKRILILMIVLAITILLGILITAYTQSRFILFLTMLVEFSFFSVIFLSLLTFIYGQKEVTLNKLYAAVTSYLVLGILFAILYALIEAMFPGAFQYTVSATQTVLKSLPHPAFFSEALYFSFVTLGTLGYGDWVPTFGPLKMLASLEAISGQLFVAILIGRLVGVQISQSLAIKKSLLLK